MSFKSLLCSLMAVHILFCIHLFTASSLCCLLSKGTACFFVSICLTLSLSLFLSTYLSISFSLSLSHLCLPTFFLPLSFSIFCLPSSLHKPSLYLIISLTHLGLRQLPPLPILYPSNHLLYDCLPLPENPRIVEHPQDHYVSEGNPTKLICTVDGNPEPTVTWYRNGEKVATEKDEIMKHRSVTGFISHNSKTDNAIKS